jgi:TRAP-type C4-dicarboxylate transport system permease small subunit
VEIRALKTVAWAIGQAATLVSGVALVAILALVAGQIAMRIFTGNSLTWSDELARLFFIYLVFIGAAETSIRHAHISVDLKDTFGLPVNIDRIVDCVRMVLCIAVLAVIAWGAWKIIPVVQNMQRPATRLSTAWMYWPVLVGSVLMIVATAINLIKRLTGQDDDLNVSTLEGLE